MFTFDSKLTMACSAAVLALAMTACSSSSDDDAPVASNVPEVVEPEVVEPEVVEPEPTDLEKAQTAASMAMDAAKTASDDAEADAVEAEMAVMNLATHQTNGMAKMYADQARKAADYAMAEYMKAKAASDGANAADATLSSALEGKINAEAAKTVADGHAVTADEKGAMATERALMELMIDGTMKMVGTTTIDAKAGALSKTADDATELTGLLKDLNPEHSDAVVAGVPFGVATDPDADTEYVQGVAPRSFAIGKTLDSSDDTARLMIVTKYSGSKQVKVYARSTADTFAGDQTGTKLGYFSSAVGAPLTTDDKKLKGLGVYTRVGIDETLEESDQVPAADATTFESKTVYSHDATPMDLMDPLTYYVVHEKSEVGGITTYTYRVVDVLVESSDDITEGIVDPLGAQVTATITEAADYEHIHFGVWAGLGEADKKGAQTIADLGIGFVQNFSKEGMTSIGGDKEDMPNSGSATYEGDWVAAVQSMDVDGDDGSISLQYGTSELTANFAKGTIAADLANLADLEGTIAGNAFSGTKATVKANTLDLDATGTFTGEFSGGFYGASAAEAGGVFDFSSAKEGAFRGSFGGNK